MAKKAENSFIQIISIEGQECFTDPDRRSEVRRTIYRHINGAGKYRRTIAKVVADLLCADDYLAEGNGIEGNECRKQVLYLAAHVCNKYKLQDSSFMRTLVRRLLSLRGNVMDWFDFMSPFGNIADALQNTLYPYKPRINGVLRDWITPQHLEALEYYLSHGNQVDLPIDRQKFPMHPPQQELCMSHDQISVVNSPIDNSIFGTVTPLTLACLAGNPDAVLLLLRHGALPVHPFKYIQCPHHDWSQPLFNLINQLNIRYRNLALAAVAQPITEVTGENIVEWRGRQLVVCFNHLSRVMTSLPVKFVQNVYVSGTLGDHECVTGRIYVDGRLRPLLTRRCAEPSDLQHCARCAVRRVLQRLNRLPQGIQKLPLPKLIKHYLDLQED